MTKTVKIQTILFCIILCTLFSSCKTIRNKCTSVYDEELKKYVNTSYDILPQYPDGIVGLSRLVLNDLVIEGIVFQTKVFVLIVISETGTPLDIRIRNKKKEDYSNLEKKVIENLQTMKDWIPAQCAGKDVSSYYIYPINLHYE